MTRAIITAQMLRDAKACKDQIDLFVKTFGESTVVTVAKAKRVASLFDWKFAARFLDDEGRDEYQRVEGAAWAAAYIATCKRRAK